jgi:hypothetical protein
MNHFKISSVSEIKLTVLSTISMTKLALHSKQIPRKKEIKTQDAKTTK